MVSTYMSGANHDIVKTRTAPRRTEGAEVEGGRPLADGVRPLGDGAAREPNTTLEQMLEQGRSRRSSRAQKSLSHLEDRPAGGRLNSVDPAAAVPAYRPWALQEPPPIVDQPPIVNDIEEPEPQPLDAGNLLQQKMSTTPFSGTGTISARGHIYIIYLLIIYILIYFYTYTYVCVCIYIYIWFAGHLGPCVFDTIFIQFSNNKQHKQRSEQLWGSVP